MKLIKCKNECDVCDSYRVSTQEKINKYGPQIESNLIYMCERCKDKYNNEKWTEWLQAIKLLQGSTAR